MEVEWFCQVMGSEVGPLSQSQLIEMVRQQKVNPEDLVKRNDSPWVAAFAVKGLFAAAAKPAKPKIPKSDRAAPATPPDVASPPATLQADTLAAQAANPSVQSESPATPVPEKELLSTQPASVSCGDADWFCIASGEKQGPLEFLDLQSLVTNGRLRPTDRVWRSSSPKFRKASEIEGLQAE